MDKLELLIGLLNAKQILELYAKVENLRNSLLPSTNPEVDELYNILKSQLNKINTNEENNLTESKKTI